MKQKITQVFLVIVCFNIYGNVFAQSSLQDTTAVAQVIRTFFKGMQLADTSMIKRTLSNDVIFQSVATTVKGNIVKTEQIANFFKSIAQTTPGSLNEQLDSIIIHTDGKLASVWTPYHFYYQQKLLHCGNNSFQLINTEAGWKIQYIIDTRYKCTL
jgi:ketosteroid isomerase-like protein